MTTLALPSYTQISDADEAALTDLYRRSTPPNILRAWERGLENGRPRTAARLTRGRESGAALHP